MQNQVEGLKNDKRKLEAINANLKQVKQQESIEQSELLSQTQSDFQDRLDKEVEAHAFTRAKYEELAKFEAEKTAMLAENDHLKKTIEAERIRHQEIVANQERKNMKQKAWLKNEMMERITETKRTILAKTEDQLHKTTKRTITENQNMTSELEYMSYQTTRIMKRNQQLEKSSKDLKRKLEISEEAQSMLAKRTQFFQKYIKKLTDKLSIMEKEALQEHGNKQKELSDIKRAKTNFKKSNSGGTLGNNKVNNELVKKLQAQLMEQTESVEQLTMEGSRLKEQLTMAETASRKIISLQDETTAFILSCVEEIKELQSHSKVRSGHAIVAEMEQKEGPKALAERWNHNKPIPSTLGELSGEEKLDVLELLLQKLSYYDATRQGAGKIA